MNLILIFLLWALVVVATCKDIESNDISIPPPPVNLDSTLRKALLRALTELENEENAKENAEDEGNSKTVFFSTTVRTDSDKIVEKASASAVSIFTQDGRTSTEKLITTELTEKPIVVIQKSDGVQHRPIISVLNNNPNEEFITSASSSFTNDNFVKVNYQTRSTPSVAPNSVVVNEKRVTPGVKSISVTPKLEVTSPQPTSTTEENEAKVEDVQFFSAPLVAAFTVHQDERGLPKKVEPIYKTPGQITVSSKQLENHERLKHHDLQRQEQLNQIDFLKRHEQYRHQLNLQEKQKLLEQEIFNLQQQQKTQQDYLVRQQQLLLEQQIRNQRFLSDQGRQNLNDQPFVPIVGPIQSQTPKPFTQLNNQNQFKTSTVEQTQNQQTATNNQFKNTFSGQNQNNFNQNQLKNNFNAQNQNKIPTQSFVNTQNSFKNTNTQTPQNGQFKNQFTTPVQFNTPNHQFTTNNQFSSNGNNKFNTFVSLQPSVSLSPGDLAAGVLPLNAQILPVRNAINFLQSPPVQQNFNQFASLTPPLQQQTSFGKFQNFQNNFVQSLPVTGQSPRVFRQEAGVGNSGFNNQFNQFQQPQQNRFFRSNLDGFGTHPNQNQFHQSHAVNQQLNNLLYHSGITRNVRQNEDLNIVSKILSYNVGRDNLFSGSRVSEQRLPASKKH